MYNSNNNNKKEYVINHQNRTYFLSKNSESNDYHFKFKLVKYLLKWINKCEFSNVK